MFLNVGKNLKDSDTPNLKTNEDLTQIRNTLAYRACQLKKKVVISQTWTIAGKIFLKDNRDRINTITTEFALKKRIMETFPRAIDIAYPPVAQPEDVASPTQSYIAAVMS